jgi:hypothetical protein
MPSQVIAHVVYFNHDEGREAVGLFFDEGAARLFKKRQQGKSSALGRRPAFSASDDHYSVHAEQVLDMRMTGMTGTTSTSAGTSTSTSTSACSYTYAAIDTLDTFFHHMEKVKAVYSTLHAAIGNAHACYDCDIAVFTATNGRLCKE